MTQIHTNIDNYSVCEPLHTQQQFKACKSAMALSNGRKDRQFHSQYSTLTDQQSVSSY